jgi:hypothetical protein
MPKVTTIAIAPADHCAHSATDLLPGDLLYQKDGWAAHSSHADVPSEDA